MPSNFTQNPPVTRVGRFELKRELGQGAQATVWLGWDVHLEREVAVKLMLGEIDAADPWLQEARSVSQLSHPNIVPVFEADRHGAQPYLVFEYVSGPTLAQQLRRTGAMAANDAVAMMLGVLDALHTAHSAGVVHRDLKPSNILVDASGRARVMDFGIAARVQQPASGDIVGTPGYMSPEAIRGAAPAPAMDIFAAGLVLGEMLSGQRVVAEREPSLAMQRILHQDLQLPANLSSAVDDPLRALLLRALARDPANRWPNAKDFRDALQQWLAPASDAPTAEPAASGAGAGSGSGGSGNATLDFLLRRMRYKTDFPALSDSVSRIRKATNSERGSLAALSDEILKDVALTNKLLRLVNTAHFSSSGGGNISTVSRAVSLVGFTMVRDLATSLVLLEHMQDKTQAGQVFEEFLRALMAGTLAAKLGESLHNSEDAFIGAMFHNLGRLLTEYYFVEEARQIRGIVAAAALAGSALVSEEAAAVRVLGISLEELGLGVAKSWGLPESLKRCMRRSSGPPPIHPSTNPDEQLRWLTLAANQITEIVLHNEPKAARAKVAKLAAGYARALGLSAAAIEAATAAAQRQIAQMAAAMDMSVGAASPARRLFGSPATPAAQPADTTETHKATAPTDATDPLDATLATPRPADTIVSPRAANGETVQLLSKGIEDITGLMVENFKLNEVLRVILDTMHRALGARRVLFCLHDQKLGMLTGRFGLGEDAAKAAASMRVPLKEVGDLFAAVCLKGADTLVTDATHGHFASRLPLWYSSSINAPAFLLMPMMMKGSPFALIYADHGCAGGIALDDRELGLVRTLRNQAVMAFKQQA